MFEPNPQKPFAYLPRKLQKTVQPLNYKYSTFPANYVAMCISCLLPYQKVPKRCELCKALDNQPLKKVNSSSDVYCISCDRRLPCRKCGAARIKRLTAPWILLPPELPRAWGFQNYLAIHTPFSCNVCGLRYLSLAIYVTLCDCKEHSIKVAHFVCRYCCPIVDPKLIKAIERARKEKSNKHKVAPRSETFPRIQMFRTELRPEQIINSRFWGNLPVTDNNTMFEYGVGADLDDDDDDDDNDDTE
jgi:hypothetical protein